MPGLNEYVNGSGDKVCAECGKVFYIRVIEDYAWKYPSTHDYFCCYTHMIHWRDRRRAEQKKRLVNRPNPRRKAVSHDDSGKQ